MIRTARNWEQRIFEPGTTFLIRDQVAQDPNFQISNNRRAAAYAGDVAGSMILAPLLVSTATQIGAGLYNAAAPEALDIPAEGLVNLAALGAMGYGAYKGISRFRNAGGWPGLMGKFGKFADRATVATPGPKPGPDVGPMPASGPGPQGPMPPDDVLSFYNDDVYGPDDFGPLYDAPVAVAPPPSPLVTPIASVAPPAVAKTARKQSAITYDPNAAATIAQQAWKSGSLDQIPSLAAQAFGDADLSSVGGRKAYEATVNAAQREYQRLARSAVPTVPTVVVPVQAVPTTTAIVLNKTARNQKPATIAVSAQQVPEPTIQDLAALAMQEEAKRRARVQMILDTPLSQIPTSPDPVSIPRAAGQLTLANLHNNPYSSDILNSWQIQS